MLVNQSAACLTHVNRSCSDALASVPGAFRYQRPEQTLLYRIIEQHYPDIADFMAELERTLPGYVQREFEDYLKWPT